MATIGAGPGSPVARDEGVGRAREDDARVRPDERAAGGPGRARKGQRVLVLVADRDVRVLTAEGELLRQLTLDSSRDTSRSASGCLRCPETSVSDVLRLHIMETVGIEPTSAIA
jgi:hypothetical protein